MLILDQQIMDYDSINIITRYPDWDISTTYNFGDVLFEGHYYYKSIVDDNLGFLPSQNDTKWLRWSISNRYAAIDLQSHTRTICDADSISPQGDTPHTLVMEFENNNYDTIALGEVEGTSLTIEVIDSSGAVTQTLNSNIQTRYCVTSWWNYFYCPLVPDLNDFNRDFIFRLDTTKGKIRVTITEGIGGYSSVGYIVSGQSRYVGDTLFNVNMGLIDYSRKEVDDFGILSLKRRDARQTMDIDIVFDSFDINRVNRVIKDVLGRVVLFINDEDPTSKYEHLLLLGLVDGFTTILSNPIKTQASIALTEVI